MGCNHNWIFVGGRACPVGYEKCSQSVYECSICSACDYGEKGGPADLECNSIKCPIKIEFVKLYDKLTYDGPCLECDDGGWVQVYSPNPPSFNECPNCHNPENLPSP